MKTHTRVDTVCVELTSYCPLMCVHCSANAHPLRRDFVSEDLLLKRLQDLAPLQELYLSGGEPFAHSKIISLVANCSRIAKKVIVYSSGVSLQGSEISPLNKELLYEAYRAGMSRVDFSIYSENPEIHESVTQLAGSLQATLTSIQILKELQIPFGIHYVPLSENSEDIYKVADLARNLGAERFHVLALLPQGRGRYLEIRDRNHNFLSKLQALPNRLGKTEVVISSNLRKRIGFRAPTIRDSWCTLFIDSLGHVYQGEGHRNLFTRSKSSIYSLLATKTILQEINIYT